MFPIIPVAEAGLGLLSSFGHHRPKPFQFHPDENDPELRLRRSLLARQNEQDYGQSVNEIGRAGLLGTDAGFAELNAARDRGSRLLEDTNASALAKQRQDQLDLYKMQYENEMQNQRQSLLALGDLGESIGGYYGQGNGATGSHNSPYFIGPPSPGRELLPYGTRSGDYAEFLRQYR